MTSRSPSPGAAPRGTRMPRAQREAQILTIAEAVFAERGYQATTMEDIAEQVGVTKPLIYEYFGSKEGLLSACIASARTQLRDASVAAWQSLPPGAPLADFFEVGVRAFFDFIDDHASAFALIQHEGAVAASASSSIESIRVQQSEVLVETLQRMPGLTDLPPVLLEGYAEVIIGACERVAVWRTRHSEATPQDCTDLVMSAVWGGLNALVSQPDPV